jgi:hypothetical protein
MLEEIRVVKIHQRQTEQSELVGNRWNSSRATSFLLHVEPSGDGFGCQAVMEHYSVGRDWGMG